LSFIFVKALLVNPYEIGNVAKVLHRALCMPGDERELRLNSLRNRERKHDVNFWMHSFLKAIGALLEEDGTVIHFLFMTFRYLNNIAKIFLLQEKKSFQPRCSR